MQEIDKLLKKNKDWPYLRVLKALTLIRMNRQKEGTDILNEVHKEAPFDESTLQTMTICYRDLHQRKNDGVIYTCMSIHVCSNNCFYSSGNDSVNL